MFKKLSSLLAAVLLLNVMLMPVAAIDFSPSVEAKPAPDVVDMRTEDGVSCVAIIKDSTGKQLVGVPDGECVVTPLAKIGEAEATISQKMQSAYRQIQSVRRLTELSSTLEATVREISSDIRMEDLVVRDLFDVTVKGTYMQRLAEQGNNITLRFQLSADSYLLAAVLHNIEGTKWETIPNNCIVRNDDQTVDVTFNSLSPIAFVFDAGELRVDPNGPKSPQTGDASAIYATVMAAGLVVAAGAAVIVAKKRANENV